MEPQHLSRLVSPNPQVRQVLEQLDQRVQQEGAPTYQELEAALEEARRSGDRRAGANLSLQMAMRLSSIATVSRALAARGQGAGSMPDEADALEPAIDLFNYSREMALSIGEVEQEKFASNGLAGCYLQSRQFEKALALLTRLFDMCSMPADALLCFDVSQKAGDCCLELENDAAALTWYERGMGIAREIDDPFEISVQHGKIASALGNLKRYDEAIEQYGQARSLLIRLSADEALQQKVSVHRNIFNVSALPYLIADIEERLSRAREGLGRDLLRELPEQLAAGARAVLGNRALPDAADWVVFRELDTAVRSAATVLSGLLEDAGGAEGSGAEQASPLALVGALARRYGGEEVRDPEDLPTAARYLVQLDRSRRAALQVRRAEGSVAGPGPFGGAESSYVVYLRSFIANPRLPRFEVGPWGEVDLEELFACLLDRSPVIALGNLELERFGPGRARTSDENWRDVLRALVMEAQMLLVLPAPTVATSWEIEWVVMNKFLHKTCFVMPPPRAGDEEWWAENWGKLRDWAVRLGVDLPEYTPEGCVFRLTSEGLTERMELSEVYVTGDLHTTLLAGLLFRTNISYDFLYGMQQGIEQQREASGDGGEGPSLEERAAAIGGDGVSAEDLATLHHLETVPRAELSNWHYDEPQMPNSPGVLLLYETPFRLLWAEEVSDLRDALTRHAAGAASDFTRAFFHLKVVQLLTAPQVEQLLDKRLSIEEVVSFRIRQMVSYRFAVLPSPAARTRVVELLWGGASKHGAPQLPRPER